MGLRVRNGEIIPRFPNLATLFADRLNRDSQTKALLTANLRLSPLKKSGTNQISSAFCRSGEARTNEPVLNL